MEKGVSAKKRKRAKSKRLVPVFALLFFWCVLFAPAQAAEDFDFSYDIRYMIQMNPDFSTYSGAGGRPPDGVIWLKRVDCGIAPDGGIERQTMWILLGRKGLPHRWLDWNIPVPKGCYAEVLEASIYSAQDGEIIDAAFPVDSTDGTVRSVKFFDLPEEFVMVVHYREVFPEKLSIDDMVWISEPLPVWETAIRVTVPAGHPFSYFSSQNHVPQEEKIDDRMVYEWRVINTAAEVHPSIRADDRDYVVFGSRGDMGAFARFLRTIEGERLPPPPPAVRDMLGFRQGAKITESVLSWLYEQPEIVLMSESREIPAEAPWTTREKLLLANSWLKEGGVDTRLFWRLPYSPKGGYPVCEAAIADPVLLAGAFYYDMERSPKAKGSEALLSGVAYGLQGVGDSLEEHRPATRKAAENRMSANFNLSLSENGVLTGTIRIAVRNAWRQFLFPENPTSEDLAEWMKDMFTQVPHYSDVTFRESGTESEVTVTLSGSQAIKGTGGNHIMASLPPLIPEWLKTLNSGPFPCNLLFPFVMDARVTLALPASTTNVFLPSQVSKSAGKVRYSESYKFEKRKKFLAEFRMTVDTTSVSEDEGLGLDAAVQGWQSFMTQYLPVQLKAR